MEPGGNEHFPAACPLLEPYMRDHGVWAALEADTRREFLCHRFISGGPQRPAYVVELTGVALPSLILTPRHPINIFDRGGLHVEGVSSHWKITTDALDYFDEERIRQLSAYHGWHVRMQEPWICLKAPQAWEVPGPEQVVELMRQARSLVEVLMRGVE